MEILKTSVLESEILPHTQQPWQTPWPFKKRGNECRRCFLKTASQVVSHFLKKDFQTFHCSYSQTQKIQNMNYFNTSASGRNWEFWGKSTETHVAVRWNFSGPVSATDLVKVSKDAASLLVCTKKKLFCLGGHLGPLHLALSANC